LASPAEVPAWYQPRELVPGGNEPPAPRVAPALELLDARALEQAAAYAGAHDSQALIVARHDHIVFERYWHGSAFDTLADAGAFTRVAAALAAGHAVAHRRIGWPDEPIGYFLASWRHDPRGAITLRNLLQMSSGLAAAAPSRAPWGAAARALFGTDVTAAALGERLISVPGRSFAMQSADPQLLSLVLERATGARYASYLSQALWRRIGAADAWLYLDRPGGAAHADCCMLARQGDWIRVGELMLRDGNYRGYEIIRPGWVTLMRTPARANPDYGAYVRLSARAAGASEPYAARDAFAVDGGGNRLWLIPSLELAILRTGGADSARGFDDARIPNLIVRGARDFLPPPVRPGGLSGLVPGH
ncbi:MAG TPA: serine hydrolase, partial [Steroidobacteraceae bacterium]|nr:serine hydrolase [Steroidobacteraceae bacterium]